MAWILQCLLWTSLVLSTYSHNYFGFGFPSYFDYPNYDDTYSPVYPTSEHQRKTDHDYSDFHRRHDDVKPHDEEHEKMSERSTPRQNERPAQERSSPVYPTPGHQRRMDHDYSDFHQKHDDFKPHDEEHEMMSERSTPRQNERSTQERSNPVYPTLEHQSRIDHDYSDFHQRHDDFKSHDKEHAMMSERSTLRQNERPAQERSISVNSGLQRIQEQERRRIDTRIDEVSPRNNNGSYKIVNMPKNYSAISNRRGQIQDEISTTSKENVVFPGPTSKTEQQYIPEVPEECLKTNVCEDVPNYPEELVESIIEKFGADKFKIDEIDTPEIAQRIGPPEDTELCKIQDKIIVPKAAADKDGKWHYIVNRKDRPLQGVLVELCEHDRSPCSKIVYYGSYEAICKQKYVLRYLTALDENGNMVEKSFRIPSCCSCIVKQIE